MYTHGAWYFAYSVLHRKEEACILKKMVDRQNDDPVKMIYHEMLKYHAERNWTNNVHELRSKYNLP